MHVSNEEERRQRRGYRRRRRANTKKVCKSTKKGKKKNKTREGNNQTVLTYKARFAKVTKEVQTCEYENFVRTFFTYEDIQQLDKKSPKMSSEDDSQTDDHLRKRRIEMVHKDLAVNQRVNSLLQRIIALKKRTQKEKYVSIHSVKIRDLEFELYLYLNGHWKSTLPLSMDLTELIKNVQSKIPMSKSRLLVQSPPTEEEGKEEMIELDDGCDDDESSSLLVFESDPSRMIKEDDSNDEDGDDVNLEAYGQQWRSLSIVMDDSRFTFEQPSFKDDSLPWIADDRGQSISSCFGDYRSTLISGFESGKMNTLLYQCLFQMHHQEPAELVYRSEG